MQTSKDKTAYFGTLDEVTPEIIAAVKAGATFHYQGNSKYLGKCIKWQNIREYDYRTSRYVDNWQFTENGENLTDRAAKVFAPEIYTERRARAKAERDKRKAHDEQEKARHLAKVDFAKLEKKYNVKAARSLTQAERETAKAAGASSWQLKNLSGILQLSNGKVFLFRKPNIETSFCYCADYNGLATKESVESARNCVQAATNSVNYFINRNMDQFCHRGDLYEDIMQGYMNVWAIPQIDDNNIVTLRFYENSEWARTPKTDPYLMQDERESAFQLTGADLENYKTLLISERAKFAKRLIAYVKRYGLTKIHAWNYYSD